MGAFADNILEYRAASAPPIAPEDPTILGEASKGVSRGLRDFGASAMQGAGMGAEYFGQNDMAKSLRGGAQSLRESAQAFAPEVQSWDQAHGLGQSLRWGFGKAGEMVPMVGGAAVGGLVAGPAGAMATMVPGQFGAIDAEQQANPRLAAQPIETRVGNAALPALGSAALMSLPGESIIGKMGLPAAKSAAGALAGNVAKGAVIGGTTMGGADALVQQGVDPNAPTDWGRAGEAALGGAVAVGGMHALHAVPSYLKGQGQSLGDGFTSIRDRLAAKAEALKQSAGDKADAVAETPTGQKVGGIYDDLGDLLQKGKDAVHSTVGKVMRGEELGIDPAELATASKDRIKEMMDFSDNEKVKATTQWGKDVMDDVGLDAETRQKAADFMANSADSASQMGMAALKKTVDLGKAAGRKIDEFTSAVKQSYKDGQRADVEGETRWVDDPTPQITDGTKKSEDYSGVQAAILKALNDNGLAKRRPELFQSAGKVNELADNLRVVLDQMARGPLSPKVVEALSGTLGVDTDSVINSMRRALKADMTPKESEAYFTNLNNITATAKRTDDLNLRLKSMLAPEHQDMPGYDLMHLGDKLQDHARGFLADPNEKPTPQGTAADNMARSVYEHYFGDNADAASKLIEKEAKIKVNDDRTQYMGEELDQHGRPLRNDDTAQFKPNEGKFDENGDRLEAPPENITAFGLTAPDDRGNSKVTVGGRAMLSPEAFKRDKVQGLDHASQKLMDLEREYAGGKNEDGSPRTAADNGFNVKFEPTAPGSDYGHVTVEHTGGADSFGPGELHNMKADEAFKKSSNNLSVGGMKLDPTKIASETRRMLTNPDNPYDSKVKFEPPTPENYALQTARAFSAGIARLSDQFGKPIDVPDSARIGTVSGKPLLWGEARRLVSNSAEDRMSPKGKAELADLRSQYKGADPQTQADILEQVHALHEREKNKELLNGSEQTARADAVARLEKNHAWHKDNAAKKGWFGDVKTDMGEYPMENSNGNYDAEGNLTKSGAQALLSGNADGGIDINSPMRSRQDGTKEGSTRPDPGRFGYEDPNMGQGRPKIGADENVHLTAAVEGEDMKRGSNMDGSPQWINKNVSKAERDQRTEIDATTANWRDTKSVAATKLADRTDVLRRVTDTMSAADKRRFYALAGTKPSEAADTINALAREYKDQIIAPEGKVEPGVGVAGEQGNKKNKLSGTLTTDAERAARQNELNDAFVNDTFVPVEPYSKTPMKRTAGVPPSPKELAAKKAALLEAASSSDPKLLKELSTTTDAKGLQRAAEVLAVHDPQSEALKAANDRLGALVRGSEDVGYGLQTKKYSLESTRIHNDLERDGFPATHDSPIRHEGKFDWRNHQGGGEGNASFGAGTYLSTADGVHRSYKEQFSAKGMNGGPDDIEMHNIRAELSKTSPAYQRAHKRASELFQQMRRETTDNGNLYDPWDSEYRETRTDKYPALKAEYDAVFERILSMERAAGASPTYHVSVDINPERLLDWDKPLSKQSELVQKALTAALADAELKDNAVNGTALSRMRVDRKYGGTQQHKDTGKNLYSAIEMALGSQAKASDYLQSLGILGHKYAAAGGKNDTHPNYVIYDDSKISTNYVHFDRSSTDPNTTHATGSHPEIRAHIDKVLGPQTKLAWANFSHAGEFQKVGPEAIIRLSVHALDPLSTAYHESLHGFFARLRDAGANDITGVLERTAQSGHVLRQLTERYKNQPDVLRQLADPEERAAYMYQAWASDPTGFKVSLAARNVFQKIAQFIRDALGIWSNDERALHIMKYFHEGEYQKNSSSPSAVRAELMERNRNHILETAKTFTEPLGRMADAMAGMGSDRVRATQIPALIRLADEIKREGTDARGGDRGFIQAARVEATKRGAALGQALDGFTRAHLQDAMEALQANTPAGTPEARLAARAIKKFLRDQHEYMKQAGVDIKDWGPDYFPRIWDTHYISKNQQAFRDMLEPYARKGHISDMDGMIRRLIVRGGSEFGIDPRESPEPGMQHAKTRLWDFISPQDAAQFVNKDLMGTLSSYISQATRKAEWTRRLGGGKLEKLMAEAKQQGATPEHLALAEDYMKGVDGTLGEGLNPTARRLMGNMIVYQNIRLLPTAAFSMLIDPNGVMVRGGTLKDAWKTFTRGMAGIPKTFGKEGGEVQDRATQMAELVGVVDSAMMSHVMGDIYTQGMVGGTAKSLNDTFFKYNMVEGLNRNFRIGATEAAVGFLGRHAGGLEGKGDSAHSERWMKELGLQKGDIIKTRDGIALTEQEGLGAAQVQRVHAAINQWVDGAVLRPDAADKPIWMNDPHFALFAHLKQFIFSFQKTILERTAHELRHGNYTPAMALASYVPIMLAADYAKGMLVTGGGTPAWQQGWDLSDYVDYAIQRAGLYGVGQFGLDTVKDIRHGGLGVGALAGPTVGQFGDIISTLGGHKEFGNTVIDALPANTFIKGWFDKGESKADPMMAD